MSYAYFRPPSWAAKHRRVEPYSRRIAGVLRCCCGKPRRGHFCHACLDRLPEELRRELNARENAAGDPDWLRVCENWLRCNPAAKGLA